MKRTFLFAAILFATLITGCKKDDEPTAYDLADSSKGGIMYDQFWSSEAGYDQASINLATFNARPDFFKCKQCHAWDGLGTAGSYINRSARTTRPNVSASNLYQFAKTKTEQEIFDGLKKTAGRRSITTDLSTYNPATPSTQVDGDKMPNYSELLTDAQIWNIVKFLKEGMFDVSQLYDGTYTGTYPTGTATFANIGKNGIEANGNTFFTANCISCHGADGRSITLETMSLGKFTRSKPNEVQHKAKYGQLGSSMVGKFDMTIGQMKDLYKALSNTITFPD
jgi:mono/diheme cytochrome c family protein